MLTIVRALLLAAACCCPGLLAAQPLRISIAVPGPGAASYLPIELIQRLGTDKAEGAEVQVTFAAGGGLAIAEMLSNNVDFAAVGLPAAMSARLTDRRIVALAAMNDLPLYALLVREGLRGKVKSIADLKGRTIGVHSNSLATKTNSHQLLELVLREGGVPPDQYRVVAVGQRWESESAMLKTGTADAIMGDEPYATRMIAERTAFSLLHLGDPEAARRIPGGGFLRGVVIGRSDKLAVDSRKAETMVRILQRTLSWLATHTPEEIVDKAGIATAEERKYAIEVLRKYPRQYSRDGRFSTRQLAETQTFFRRAQAGDPAAEALEVEALVVDRWAGRRD